MAKCKNCNNLYNLSDEDDKIVGKWCPKKNDSPDIEMERECKYYDVMTNADRIRSMTDEELAKFLFAWGCNDNGWCDDCPSINGKYCNCVADAILEGKLTWLQSPVED